MCKKQDENVRKVINDLLPDEEKTTKDLIIKELIKTVETILGVNVFAEPINASYKFLENRYATDEEFLAELENWNNSYSGNQGFDNPETFIMLATLMMARQSGTPDTFPNFLKSYNELCETRNLHSFQKE